MKKGDISINTIIAVILLVIVLIVLVVIYSKELGQLFSSLSNIIRDVIGLSEGINVDTLVE